MAFLPITIILRRLSSVVHHKVSGSYVARTVWRRITKFYMDIHTDPLYSHSGYDVTRYFRSGVIANNNCRNAAYDFASNFTGGGRGVVPGQTNWWASCFFFRTKETLAYSFMYSVNVRLINLPNIKGKEETRIQRT